MELWKYVCLMVFGVGCSSRHLPPTFVSADAGTHAATDAGVACSAATPFRSFLGTYGLETVQTLSAGGQHFVGADVDGDGVAELVQFALCPRIWRFQGARYVSSDPLCADGDASSSVGEVIDLNHDGALDIAVLSGTQLRVYLQHSGSFSMTVEATVWPGGSLPEASQLTVVQVADGRSLLLMGWRGQGSFDIARDPSANDNAELTCTGTITLNLFRVTAEGAPVVGYWFNGTDALQVSSEVSRLNLHADVLGSSVTDLDQDGTQEVVLTHEHWGTQFLEVSPEGTVSNLLEANAAPRVMTSGMGMSVLSDHELIMSDVGRIFVYSYADHHFTMDTTHPLMSERISGNLWACHAQDWLSRGELTVLCAVANPDSGPSDSDLPPGANWQAVRDYFSAERGQSTVEPAIIGSHGSTWRGYGRAISIDDLANDLTPLPDPAHPGQLLVLRRSLGEAISAPNTVVMRPQMQGMSVGHGLIVRFASQVPIGTRVTMTCNGSEQTRQYARTGSWTHTDLISFGCASTDYTGVRVEFPPRSGHAPITCPAGSLDRVLTVSPTSGGCQ